MALRIHERYLIRETVSAVLLVLVAFLALFGFFDLIGELKDVRQGGYELRHAVGYVALRLPGRVYELTPIAVLIGALYSLSTLARHSEINVLRVSGMSTADLFRILAKAAGIFAFITLVVGEFVAPFTERAAQELRLRATDSLVAQQFRTGLWLKDGTTFVNVRAVSPDARLQGVRIYEFDGDFRLKRMSEASGGQYLPPDAWRLQDVLSSELNADGTLAQVERRDELRWRSALNPDILSVLLIVPERMSLVNLVTYIRHLTENHQKTQRYEIALWKKLIYPMACLVMVALALPFGYTHNRVAGVSLKIFSGVMVGVIFHMLNGLFSSLGVINSWPPFASAVSPSALFLIAATGMIWWAERR